MSRMDSASRMPPSAARAMRSKAAGEASAPAPCAACASRPTIWRIGMREKSNRWQRERIVAGSFCGSVVARMNTTCVGGSSSVLSSALNAPAESMCTSSTM